MGLNTLEKLQLDRQIARITEDLRRVERMLQGQPIDTVRIADLAVTSAKIESLVAGKVDADVLSAIVALLGNVTVGNALDGDGTILVKNASNVTVVTINKDGILVEGGVIEVRNQDENVILDEFGLTSTNVFSGGSATGTGIQALTTSYVDVTGVTITFDTERTQRVLLFGQMIGLTNATASANQAQGQILIDGGSPIGGGLICPGRVFNDLSAANTQAFVQEIRALTVGSHTLKLQAKESVAAGVTQVVRSGCTVGYVILGN